MGQEGGTGVGARVGFDQYLAPTPYHHPSWRYTIPPPEPHHPTTMNNQDHIAACRLNTSCDDAGSGGGGVGGGGVGGGGGGGGGRKVGGLVGFLPTGKRGPQLQQLSAGPEPSRRVADVLEYSAEVRIEGGEVGGVGGRKAAGKLLADEVLTSGTTIDDGSL
ncbi:hypothetical protein M0802_003888 [Mischocyttarus mexicanus]|nr:hypothetical protein M0802_003888 [Mischocyttarus mexicanus]